MMDIKPRKTGNKQYSVGKCLLFALFGYAALLFIILELYFLITGQGSFRFLPIASLGYAAYLFLYTAYNEKAPSWFNDVSIFTSKVKRK